MLILAFETSAKAASVAVYDGQKLLAESYQNTGLTHSQTLMVMAEDALKQLRQQAQKDTFGAACADIDEVERMTAIVAVVGTTEIVVEM